MSFCETLLEIIVRGGLTMMAWVVDVWSLNGGYYTAKIREEDARWKPNIQP